MNSQNIIASSWEVRNSLPLRNLAATHSIVHLVERMQWARRQLPTRLSVMSLLRVLFGEQAEDLRGAVTAWYRCRGLFYSDAVRRERTVLLDDEFAARCEPYLAMLRSQFELLPPGGTPRPPWRHVFEVSRRDYRNYTRATHIAFCIWVGVARRLESFGFTVGDSLDGS
jgi:hypothetical protein